VLYGWVSVRVSEEGWREVCSQFYLGHLIARVNAKKRKTDDDRRLNYGLIGALRVSWVTAWRHSPAGRAPCQPGRPW
jgi:hypothetical protein